MVEINTSGKEEQTNVEKVKRSKEEAEITYIREHFWYAQEGDPDGNPESNSIGKIKANHVKI